MSEEKPQEKPTAKFEPPPEWAVKAFERLHSTVSTLETRLEERLNEQGGKLDICIRGLGTVTDKVNALEKDHYEFKGQVNERLNNNSMRAQAQSLHDGEQDQRIAQLSESQMTALLKEIAKTPMGQKVANAVGGLLLLLIGLATAWLMAHGGHQ